MLKLKGNLEFDSTRRPADHLHQLSTNTTKIATMKTAFATLALAASASAFAPAPVVSTKNTQLSEFANGLVGGEGPEPMFSGSKEFDPVGFTEVRFYVSCAQYYSSNWAYPGAVDVSQSWRVYIRMYINVLVIYPLYI